MIAGIDLLPAIVGLALISFIALDVFDAVLLPRPSARRWRLARLLVRTSWPIWRGAGRRMGMGERRDRFLGVFAPLSVVILLGCWLVLVIVGFGLLLYAFRSQISPAPDFPGATYEAATAILTLGFTTTLPNGPGARIIALTGAAGGLGLVAVVITYLFMLFGSFQRRETLVVALSARTGTPPSGVALLESFATLDLVGEMPRYFELWGAWCSEVLDTHIAYPILGYFRSSHDNTSWVSSLGAVLDAACLVRTIAPQLPQGQAELTRRLGSHLVEDLTNFLHLRIDGEEGSGLARENFDDACRRLASLGLPVENGEAGWARFEEFRSSYAARLEAMAKYWATPRARWTGHEKPSHPV